MTVVARILVAALAVVCATVAFGAHRRDDRCAGTLAEVQRLAGGSFAEDGPRLAREVLDRCDDSRDVASVAVLLDADGDRADARTVARGLVRREPEDYFGWYLLSGLEREPAASAALTRARALNPTVGRRATRP